MKPTAKFPKHRSQLFKKFIPFFLLLFLAFNNSCTDLDDNLQTAKLEDVILKDSEMFDLIDRMTSQTNDPLEDIVCIDFVYPLEVKLYNADLIRTDSVILWSDEEFSAFLGTISESQALSISYPITTAFANGETFTVNNNEELKIVIDQCSREDIVSYYGSVFASTTGSGIVSCVWKVKYLQGYDNKYVGGTFQINPDNSLVFNYDGEDYPGNWIFLFVNDQLHININLEGTSPVATDWNIDRIVIYNGTVLEIVDDQNIMLVQNCEQSDQYAVGDTGPGGGIVFYDKGEYSNGWRYIEAAPEDLTESEWGCIESEIGSSNPAIGFGLVNSAKIVNFHDGISNYYTNPAICSDLSNGTVAAQTALTLDLAGTSDWFLPSLEELTLMHSNLYLSGLGSFTTGLYWSSTEGDLQNAHAVNFLTGETEITMKNSALVKTRAVRYF